MAYTVRCLRIKKVKIMLIRFARNIGWWLGRKWIRQCNLRSFYWNWCGPDLMRRAMFCILKTSCISIVIVTHAVRSCLMGSCVPQMKDNKQFMSFAMRNKGRMNIQILNSRSDQKAPLSWMANAESCITCSQLDIFNLLITNSLFYIRHSGDSQRLDILWDVLINSSTPSFISGSDRKRSIASMKFHKKLLIQ